jgi:hypothetical protein
MAAVERIDALFKQFGIHPSNGRRPGRPSAAVKNARRPGRPPRRKRTRKTFSRSGLESVLDFVKGRGAEGATTGEINKHWKSEGRAGTAYVTIGHLVKDRKLKKRRLVGQRGSRYTAV